MSVQEFIKRHVKEDPRSPGFRRDEVEELVRKAYAAGVKERDNDKEDK